MNDEHPLIARYMKQFESALRTHDLREWREIASDLRSHMGEALAAGKPVDALLESLGPADQLARAYAVELVMNARRQQGLFVRITKVSAILAASGCLTFFAICALGLLAILLPLGLAGLILTVIRTAGLELPDITIGAHPVLATTIFVATSAIGAAAVGAFWLYIRFMMGTLRKSLPRAWAVLAA